MKTNIVIFSEDLTKEDVQLLLQSIRDCEQKSLPDKEIGIAVFVPDLTTDECSEIIRDMKPPFKYGPIALGGKRDGD
jgi:hypothetical protein